jgi:hypothetical protein
MNNIPHEVPSYNRYEDYGQGSHVVPPAAWQESTINKKRTKQNRKKSVEQLLMHLQEVY